MENSVENIKLVCEGEVVKICDFKYLYNFNDKMFDMLMDNRKEKGFFKFKDFKYKICRIDGGKQSNGKYNKCHISEKIYYDKTLIKPRKEYYCSGEKVSIEIIASCTNTSVTSIRYNLSNTRSCILNGYNINIRIFKTTKYIAKNIKTGKLIQRSDILRLAQAVGTKTTNIRNALNTGGMTSGYTVTVEEIEL